MSSEIVNNMSPEQQAIRNAYVAGIEAVQKDPAKVERFTQGEQRGGDIFLYKEVKATVGDGTVSFTQHEPRYGPRIFTTMEVALTVGNESIVILNSGENGDKKGGIYVDEKLVTDPEVQVVYAKRVQSAADSLSQPNK